MALKSKLQFFESTAFTSFFKSISFCWFGTPIQRLCCWWLLIFILKLLPLQKLRSDALNSVIDSNWKWVEEPTHMQSKGSSLRFTGMVIRSRISVLMFSMFATFASLYVAGRWVLIVRLFGGFFFCFFVCLQLRKCTYRFWLVDWVYCFVAVEA